ncbi:MAG: DMT family transporter [Ferrovibrio sp.]|nr:DMT family transporter [Ferrovibrio sp.]
MPVMTQQHDRLDTLSIATMVVLCFLWGVQQVVIKLTTPEIPPLLQAGLRSAIASLLVLAWLGWRGVALFGRDGSLRAGLLAGSLFALEFALIYHGLQFTTASRAAILLYTAPFWVALGAHWLIPGERIGRAQLAGLLCAFAGILVAFGDALHVPNPDELFGDALLLGAALLWAATTVVIKASVLTRIHPGKTLLYQLGLSALLLPLASLALGEGGMASPSRFAIGSLAFQSIVIACVSYMIWFGLIARYPASRLSALSFLTPLFGVAIGALWLGEPLTLALLLALLLVGLGIHLVNRPRPAT